MYTNHLNKTYRNFNIPYTNVEKKKKKKIKKKLKNKKKKKKKVQQS